MMTWYVMDIETGEVMFESDDYEESKNFVFKSGYKFVLNHHVPFAVDNNCLCVVEG